MSKDQISQPDIVEMNSAITVFMGSRVSGDWVELPNSSGRIHITVLKYHEDWSLLMPAFEKIIHYGFGDGEYAHVRTCGIGHASDVFLFRFNRFGLHSGKSIIEVIHKAVFEFAKWHNSQPKTP